MLRVATEFENVPLREAHVLQDLPGCVRCALGFDASQVRRQIRYCRIKVYVRVATPQEI